MRAFFWDISRPIRASSVYLSSVKLTERSPDLRSANQVVAYNLARARQEKGWTLDETAATLAPFVGGRWTRQNLSALERSMAGDGGRRFDADDLVAFSRAFDLPLLWFLVPPDYIKGLTTGETVTTTTELLDLLFVRGWEKIRARLLDLPQDVYAHDLELLAQTVDFYLVDALSDFHQIEDDLRRIADRLASAHEGAQMRLRFERMGQPDDAALFIRPKE